MGGGEAEVGAGMGDERSWSGEGRTGRSEAVAGERGGSLKRGGLKHKSFKD